jgi:hypothetical protein
MTEPHAAVFSFSSPVLLDGRLGMESENEELCKLSVRSPPGNGTHWLDWAGQFSTIEVLPEEMVLEFFYFYKLACRDNYLSEWQCKWHNLAHVCRRWRGIIFASQHRLDLRLLCTPKTSIKSTLDLWPAFPIAVQYDSDSLSPDDRDKLTAVLQQPNRLCEINVDLYHPLSETEFQLMQGTFPLLECLMLCTWQSDMESPVLPNTFLSGCAPRLNSLHLLGIAFPALPQLLSSAVDLVDLLLHRIPSTGYISPEALVGGLSATPRLKTFTLHFAPQTFHLNPGNTPPPSSGRIILSALIQLTFNGPCNYLEDLLSRTGAPSLKHAEIEFFEQPSFDISQLSQFLGRVESQRLPNGAQAILYLPDAFVYHSRSGAQSGHLPDTSERFSLGLTCQSRFELFQINQICQQLSPLLSNVRTLDIHMSAQPLGSDDDLLDLLHLFSRVEQLHFTGSSIPDVARVQQLVSAEMAADELPALHDLSVDLVPREVFLASDSEW